MISELLKALEQELSAHKPFAELMKRLKLGGFPVEVEGVHGGFLGILAQRIHGASDGPSLVVTPTEQAARELLDDLRLFLPPGAAALFPWLGTLPYGEESRPLPSVLGDRARVLVSLLAGEPLLVVAPLRALVHPVPDPVYLQKHLLRVRKGDTVDPVELAGRLQCLGYLRVPSKIRYLHGYILPTAFSIFHFLPFPH